ncbi:MAG TPA: hypothetical protein V6C97_17040 [Oculatellaceae cyanobacterium]
MSFNSGLEQTSKQSTVHSTITECTAWLDHATSEAWIATKGAARVAQDIGTGALKEAVEHPLRTAGEVVAGIAVTAAAAELGIGALGAAALAAVPLAAYGAYEGAKIALTEGPSAIPEHLATAYESAKQSLSGFATDVSIVYNGTEGGDKLATADAHLQGVGRDATPFLAGAVGGLGSEFGKEALAMGDKMVNDLSRSLLPPLELQPALVSGADLGAGLTTSAGGGLDLTTTVAGGAAIESTNSVFRTSTPSADSTGFEERVAAAKPLATNIRHIDPKTDFVDGVGMQRADATSGLAKSLASLFSNAERVLKGEMPSGFVRMSKDGDYITAVIEDGPKAGTTAIMKQGDKHFLVEGSDGKTYQVPLE